MGATDNRPLRAGKGYLYEGGLRVPLIIRWPGVTNAGEVIDTPVVSMDLTATILEAAGVCLPPNETLDGLSLRPLLEENEFSRDSLFFHYPHYAFHKDNRPGSVIRQGHHKLILRYDDNSTELYDLQNDPAETNNLVESKPEQAAKLEQQLRTWLAEQNAGIPTSRK
jgi:arylsulfatase A-like enzyme